MKSISSDCGVPEPKPLLIFLLGVGGALGAVLLPVTGLLAHWEPQAPREFALRGGVTGLALGVALAISRIPWVRVPVATALGLVGIAIAVYLGQEWRRMPVEVNVSLDGICAALWGMTLLLIAHEVFLRCRSREKSWVYIPIVYLAAGGLSGAILEVGNLSGGGMSGFAWRELLFNLDAHRVYLPMAWFMGMGLGIGQLLGMLAAAGFDAHQTRMQAGIRSLGVR